MAAAIRKPRKINPVSVTFFVVLFGLIYGAIQFGPPYYRKWKVKEVLSVTANAVYPKRMATGSALQTFINELQKKAMQDLRGVGITDPSLRITIIKQQDDVVATADYKEIIKHWGVDKTTTLAFRPSSTISLKPPEF
jgi:hypothetical protein